MWLNIKWYGTNDTLLREDGAYGPLHIAYDITGDGKVTAADSVDTLLDLDDPNTKIYEAHGAITQDWAAKLITVSGTYSSVPVAYDRVTGAVTATVGDVATMASGSYHETFHFVLNNKVVKDNRIPPYGMSYDEGLGRSVLPVPNDQYGNPGPGGTYNYFDEVTLNPPAGALYANISLMYQPTSWEYIQFLALANNGSSAFLGNEGHNIFDGWFNTGMAAPYTMATAAWTAPPDSDGDGLSDIEEAQLGTNPNNVDSDGDGLVDGAGGIVTTDSYPGGIDSDGDGFVDGEQDHGTSPVISNRGDLAPTGAPDNLINVGDLLVLTRLVTGAIQPTGLEPFLGDLNGDSQLDTPDVLLLQKALLNGTPP